MLTYRVDLGLARATVKRGAIIPAIERSDEENPVFCKTVMPLKQSLAESKEEYLSKLAIPGRHFGRRHKDGIECPFYGCDKKFHLMGDMFCHINKCPIREQSIDQYHPGTIYCKYCVGWIPHDKYQNPRKTALLHMKYGCSRDFGVFHNPLRVPLHSRFQCSHCNFRFSEVRLRDRHMTKSTKCPGSKAYRQKPQVYAKQNETRKELRHKKNSTGMNNLSSTTLHLTNPFPPVKVTDHVSGNS